MDTIYKISQMTGDIQGQGTGVLIAVLVLGALNCFLGYKLMKFWVTLLGAVVGAAAGYQIVEQMGYNQLVAVIAAVLAGAFLAFLAFHIYLAGVFLLCGCVGLLLSSYLIRPTSSGIFFVCLIIGVAVGILAVKFVKPMVILSTSLQGGLYMGGAIAGLTGLAKGDFPVYIGLACGIFGVLAQFLLTARRKGGEEDEEN